MTWEVPSWFDEKFLATILQRDEKKRQISILKYSAKPAVPFGENNSSLIFRASVEYKSDDSAAERSASLIIKAPHTNGLAVETPGYLDILKNEKRIYVELLPKIYGEINHQFGPKIFHCSMESVLVLEDLVKEGYIMAERNQQLDFSHCALALSTLAKYHACSVAIHKEDPEFVEGLGKELLYSEESPIGQLMKGWIDPLLNTISGVLKNLDGCEKYVNLLSSKLGIWDSLVETFKPKENKLNVLNHGDFWMNNILFKLNDAREATEIKIIDFAVPRYTSPASDIVYFICSSANEDVREDRLEELSDVYLQSLNRSLEQLQCDERMTKSELTEELKRFGDYALTVICQSLPHLFADPKDAMNVEELTMEETNLDNPSEKMMKIYQGKRFLAALPTALRHRDKWLSS